MSIGDKRRAPRSLIVVAVPIAMVCAFVTVLFRDIGRAFYYAWLEARIELDRGRQYWPTRKR